MRNPWNKETYRGDWSDRSSKWTNEFREQVPYANNYNDGSFFISLSDFIQGFKYFTVTYVNDDWSVSYYEQNNFRLGTNYKYSFTIEQRGPYFVGADIYPERMYPPNCRGSGRGNVRLW